MLAVHIENIVKWMHMCLCESNKEQQSHLQINEQPSEILNVQESSSNFDINTREF